MAQTINKAKTLFHYTLPVLLLVGAALRIVVYFQNRSLFIDEANLARNFVEKSLIQFFQPLDYEQYSPPLFSVVEKLNLWLFGPTEYALRIFPLLSSLVVLFLFYRLSQRFITNPYILLFAIFILSFSNIFLEYATTVKQYMSDTMVALWLVYLAIHETLEIFSWRQFFKWTCIGAIVVWFSMTSVFVLAGVGLYFFYIFFKKREMDSIFRLGSSIGCWLLSFGVYYFSILKTDVGSDYLNNFHQDFFLPKFPHTAEDWTRIVTIFRSILRSTVGYTTLAYGLGLAGFVGGLWYSFKNRNLEILLLLLPILICLAASTMQLYSLMPRLTLFFLPFLLIIIALGWQLMMEKTPTWGNIVISFLLVAVAGLHDSYQFFIKKYEIEDIQTIMQYVQAHQQPEDVVFVYLEAVPAFQFYKNNHQNKAQYDFKNIILGDYDSYPTKAIFHPQGQTPQRVWLIYSHVISEVTRQRMAKDLEMSSQFATEIDRVEAAGAYGFLLILPVSENR